MDTSEREILFQSEPGDVPLPAAPLLRVIGQLRFGALSVLAADDDAAQAFIKLLAEDYPYVEQGEEQVLLLAPGQPVHPQSSGGKVWRLRTADRRNVVTLTNGVLTYETPAYSGRTAFCRELSRLINSLQQATRLRSFSRIAVRYSNRLTGPDTLSQLSALVQPEILGVADVSLATGVKLSFLLTQAQFEVGPHAKVLAQYGLLPPNATFDPGLPPAQEASWILDIDSFEEFPDPATAPPADPETLSASAHACAKRAYAFFRWATTPEFLRHYGGDPS